MKTLIVDANNLVWRAHFAYAQLPNDAGHIYGTLCMLQSIMKKLQPDRLVICWDKKPTRKLQIYPEYKGTRAKKDFNPIPTARKLLTKITASHYWASGEECDDVIASYIAQHVPAFGHHTTILTSDRDMWQLIPKVAIYGSAPVTLEMIQKSFQCQPHLIPLVKAIKGDTSDHVPSLRLSKTAHLIHPSQTIEKLADLVPSEKRLALLRNYELVKLKADVSLKVKHSAFNGDELQAFLREYDVSFDHDFFSKRIQK